MPSLHDNLMSVKKVAIAEIKVVFNSKVAVLKLNGKSIATAYIRGNLYELEIEVPMIQANLCGSEVTNLWHRRLGHLCENSMKTMVREDLVKGLNFKPEKLELCEACVQGKMCREPFDGKRERASRPLVRIHSDVCGPIEPTSWDGSRYFVSFIDDYSHFVMVFLLKKKSQVFEKFQEFEAMVTAMFGHQYRS